MHFSFRFALFSVFLVTPASAFAQAEQAEPTAEDAPPEPTVRASFQPGDGLVVESTDDQFGLSIRTRVQFLGQLDYPEADDGGPGDVYVDAGDVDLGFSIRRARVNLEGWFFGRENRFKVALAFSPNDMGVEPGVGPTLTPLLVWYAEFRHLRDLEVRVGQYKLPFSLERIISSGKLAMVDRSIVDSEFTLVRDFGLDLRSRDFLGLGLFRYYAGVSTGEGRDGGFGNDLGFWYFARVEFLPLGMFDEYSEADLERGTRPRLALGAAYAYLDEAPRLAGVRGLAPADGGTVDYHTATANVLFKWVGFSAFAEMIWREGTRNPGNATDAMGDPLPVDLPRNGVGWFVQAGYVLPGVDLQIAARYGMVHPLEASSMEEQGELGGAISYYFAGHPFKIQLDYFHLWSGGDFGDSEERVRLQLQAAL